jgi:hypothetical protein
MKTHQSLHLWGIYHIDREYAHSLGDPLLTVVEASSKLAAEEEAARLGFGDAWAHPVTLEEALKARWLPKRLQNQLVTQTLTGGIHV